MLSVYSVAKKPYVVQGHGVRLNIKFASFPSVAVGYDVGEGKYDVAQIAGQILTKHTRD